MVSLKCLVILYFPFKHNIVISKSWTDSTLSLIKFVISKGLSLGKFDRECSLSWNFPNIRKWCLRSRLLHFSKEKSLISSWEQGACLLALCSLVAGKTGSQGGLRWVPFQAQVFINPSVFRGVSLFCSGCPESQCPECLPMCVDCGFLHFVWTSRHLLWKRYCNNTAFLEEKGNKGDIWFSSFSWKVSPLTAKLENICSNSTFGTILTF